ncbi:MAG: hypothetical protein AB7L09_19960 [Nitrospira sp.]
MTPRPKQPDEISHTLARIKADALALVCAVIGGGGIFAMTAWLIIQGGPQPGQHLQLLSNYFIGYSITWWGSVVGLFYGTLTGGVVGWAVGTIYNKIIQLRKSIP